jgi:hypothetical protein
VEFSSQGIVVTPLGYTNTPWGVELLFQLSNSTPRTFILFNSGADFLRDGRSQIKEWLPITAGNSEPSMLSLGSFSTGLCSVKAKSGTVVRLRACTLRLPPQWVRDIQDWFEDHVFSLGKFGVPAFRDTIGPVVTNREIPALETNEVRLATF